MQAFTLHSFPVAIAHLDGDAFFASVEQAVHPELKGRPVVTGKERGIIACASYEAKALGIKRGVPLHEAVRRHPQLVVLPSDYETYSLYSKRMFDLFRHYTPMVEEYSIDEGFADLSGLRRLFRTSYEEIALRMQRDVREQLDITVSVGLSLSKSLAKLGSKFRKPAGFTAIPGPQIHLFLQRIALGQVWGFGPHTVQWLTKMGLRTGYDFAAQTERWAEQKLGKIGRELWHELRGESVYPVQTEEKSSYYTISKCKTFTAPSGDRDFVYARLVRNVESAFIKLRRHRLRVHAITVALRAQDFGQAALEAKLNRPTAATQEVVPLVRALFEQLFRPAVMYRSVIVVLGGLEADGGEQLELFTDRLRIEKMSRVSRVSDEINARFGKHALSLGTSLYLDRRCRNARDTLPWRKTDLLEGETARQRVNLPRMAVEV